MKKIVLTLFIMLIPVFVNAEDYYLNNLKEEQNFMCNDRIVFKTPDDLLLTDEDTIGNKYGNFEDGYGRTFVFEELDSTEPNIISPGNGAYCPPNMCSIAIPCDDNGRDIYYKISNVEYDAEAFTIYFKVYEKELNTPDTTNNQDTPNITDNSNLSNSIKNPETGTKISIIIFIITLTTSVSIYFTIKKKHNLKSH